MKNPFRREVIQVKGRQLNPGDTILIDFLGSFANSPPHKVRTGEWGNRYVDLEGYKEKIKLDPFYFKVTKFRWQFWR
ncbi:MAG TPA: hypothetical protein VLE47_02345 [Candidatus Saccharimonadales bacterium]|nr:hypothetical protein [Candidatus Saccharimonadales bacterium]